MKPVKDLFDVYHDMRDKSQKTAYALESYIDSHFDKLHLAKHQDEILKRFDEWLVFAEKVSKIESEDNNGDCVYTSSSEIVFDILAKRKMLLKGEEYAHRLEILKLKNSIRDWKVAVANEELETEINSVPDSDYDSLKQIINKYISVFSELKDTTSIGWIAYTCIKNNDTEMAQTAYDILVSINEISVVKNDEYLVDLKADIAVSKKDYDTALVVLESEREKVSKQCANKTRMKKIESKIRKVTKAKEKQKFSIN